MRYSINNDVYDHFVYNLKCTYAKQSQTIFMALITFVYIIVH